jgi:hypothetical protein
MPTTSPWRGFEPFDIPPTYPEVTAVLIGREPLTRLPVFNTNVPNRLTARGDWHGASIRADAVYPAGPRGEWLRVQLSLSADEPSVALPPACFGLYLTLRRPRSATRVEVTVERDDAAMQSLAADLEARAAHPAVRERMRQAMNGQNRRITPRNITTRAA